jgi:hypothetical protein
MPQERRNLYRILFVQPEAPPEMITAAYRCLMSLLRTHPGSADSETAERIKQAYAILRDGEKRRAYDSSRRRPLSARVPGAEPGKRLAAAHAPHVCPFCGLAAPRQLTAETRCTRCASPLAPVACDPAETQETFGRRSAPRMEKDCRVTVHAAPSSPPLSGVLHDLSATGISLYTAVPVPAGRNIRVETLGIDLVAHVLRVQPRERTYLVRGFILTALYSRKTPLPAPQTG